MTEWYYSDAQRQQHGPISTQELASLHGRRVLTPETLVWREGLSEWKPWRDLMAEVLPGHMDAPAAAPADPFAAPVSPALESPASTADPFAAAPAAPRVDDGAYRPYEIAEAAPYAPPEATTVMADQAGYVPGGPTVYAGLWKRLAASIIDSIVTMVLSYAVTIPLMLLAFGAIGFSAAGPGGGDNPFAAGAGLAMMLLIYPIFIFLPCIYFGWMQSSSLQASLGKMAVGIKVTRGDGIRIGFWRGFLRSLAYLLFCLLTCGIGVIVSGLMAALTERKQSLHDMICDTLVVDKYAFTAHKEWQRDELGIVAIVVLVLWGLLVVGFTAIYLFAAAAMFGSGLAS